MRYKRLNTLALDVSSVPTGHRLSTVQPFLKFIKLDPSKLRSVQVHSSRKLIYIGLPEDYSAAAIASKTPRFSVHIDGVKHYVPLVFIDEDVVDVRVLDLPPETPTEVIQDILRKYGDVFSVTNEVWKNFFPGILTGVRVARMKIKTHIPSFVKVGNHTALVRYSGQEAAKETNNTAQQPSQQSEVGNETQQKKCTKKDPPSRPPGNSPPAAPNHATEATRSDVPRQINEAASAEFTVVNRKRGKHQQQQQQQQQKKQQPIGHSIDATPNPQLSEKDQRTLEIWKECFLALGIPMLDDSKK